MTEDEIVKASKKHIKETLIEINKLLQNDQFNEGTFKTQILLMSLLSSTAMQMRKENREVFLIGCLVGMLQQMMEGIKQLEGISQQEKKPLIIQMNAEYQS